MTLAIRRRSPGVRLRCGLRPAAGSGGSNAPALRDLRSMCRRHRRAGGDHIDQRPPQELPADWRHRRRSCVAAVPARHAVCCSSPCGQGKRTRDRYRRRVQHPDSGPRASPICRPDRAGRWERHARIVVPHAIADGRLAVPQQCRGLSTPSRRLAEPATGSRSPGGNSDRRLAGAVLPARRTLHGTRFTARHFVGSAQPQRSADLASRASATAAVRLQVVPHLLYPSMYA